METQKTDQNLKLSLHQAAQLLATNNESIHDLEVQLAHAIEHGELQANVKRWATEQWEGRQLLVGPERWMGCYRQAPPERNAPRHGAVHH